MTLGVGIKFDPGDALPKIKGVEDGLQKVEDQGKAAAASMQTLSKSFAALADAIDRERTALQRTTEIHGRLVSQGQPLVRTFQGLAQALEREQRVLESIRGPAREHAADIAALERLYKQGKISAEEFYQAAKKLDALPKAGGTGNPIVAQREQTAQAMGTIGLGKAPASAPLVSNKTAMMAFGVAGMAAAGASQLAQLSDQYTNLSNRALKFADSGHTASLVLNEQRELARSLGVEIPAAMGAFDSVGDAVESLNYTREQQLALTQKLAQSSIIEGKAADGAAGAMKNLALAMELGGDTSRPIKAIMSEFPSLAAAWTSSLGLTKKQILELAKDGKISFQQLAKATTDGGKAIGDLFEKRAVTWDQRWTAFKDELARPIDVQGTIDQFYNVDLAINRVVNSTAKLADQWSQLEENRVEAALAKRREELLRAATTMAEVQAGGFDASEAAAKVASEWAAEQEKALERATEKAKKLSEEYAKIGKALLGNETPADRAIAAGKSDRDAFQADIARAVDAEIEAETRALKAVQEAAEAKHQAHKEWEEARNKATDEAAQKRLEKEKQHAEQVRDAWAQGLGEIGGEFLRAAADGEQSFSEMAENMAADISKLILKMAALRMVQAGGGVGIAGTILGGILGGFATGGSFRVPYDNDRLVLPRAQYGADWTVGGAGGTDSKIAMFRVTPGETVHVRTPQQQAAAAAPGQGNVTVRPIIQVQDDPRRIAEAGDSRDGARVFLGHQRKYGRRKR